jgi:REP element-mobilizing transposase RayT
MQLNLIAGTWSKKQFAFGAALLKGSHPKKKRPFRPNLAMHVVVKASRAQGGQSFFAHNRAIGRIVERQATKQFVRLYGVTNAGNHLHLLIQAPSQDHLSYFLRAITGRIAQLIKRPARERFWDARPFSRLVSWGQDFKNVARYLRLNVTGALGFSRDEARQMFERIRLAIKSGQIAKTPSLIAAGFG